MKKTIVNQRQAIKLLKEKKDISLFSIEFNEHKIEAIDAILLGKNKIDVPEHLIFYDDDSIDFSDDPDITDEDIETGKIKWIVNTEISLESEISNWIKLQNIDLSQLTTQLIKNFYQTMKNIQKNAAL